MFIVITGTSGAGGVDGEHSVEGAVSQSPLLGRITESEQALLGDTL
jgi:hypothetical protein